MSDSHNKIMNDLRRLLESQNFKSEEDMRKFADSLIGEPIPSFPSDVLTDKEKAEDLVDEAYDLPSKKARENIDKALALDADCIPAYEFLAETNPNPPAVKVFLEKGITIGRRLFGGEYTRLNLGHFWGLIETRPFMRCMQSYADLIFFEGNIKGCSDILEELVTLNPNDNQGARDLLLLCLIDLDEKGKFRTYEKFYHEDSSSFALFNRALFAFKTNGAGENTNKKLKKALDHNHFVARKLTSKGAVNQLPHAYQIGSIEEADYYVHFARPIWHKTFGSLAWLKKNAGII